MTTTGQHPPPSSSTIQDRERNLGLQIVRASEDLVLRQPDISPEENMSIVRAPPGNHSETRGRSNPFFAYSGRCSAICREMLLRILGYLPCTRRQVLLLTEYMRSDDDFAKMISQLFYFALAAICILLCAYPLEQFNAQIDQLGNNWRDYDITPHIIILYFGYYLADRLLLSNIAVVGGIQPVVRCLIYGMDGTTQQDIEMEDNSAVPIGLIRCGIWVLVLAFIFTEKVFPQVIIEDFEKLNVTIASTNLFNTTMQTSPSGASTLQEIAWDILVFYSQCLNYIIKFISNSSLLLVHFNYIPKTANEIILTTAERDDILGKLRSKIDQFTKAVSLRLRLWIKTYYWVLYFHYKSMESFPAIRDAIDLPDVRYGLGILSMAITYYYIRYFKQGPRREGRIEGDVPIRVML